jgi:TIR domain
MASKYDAYWGGQLHRIRAALQLAATGVPAEVSVPDLARLGARQSWYGLAEIRGQELVRSSGAHATSLGRQIAASGMCKQWPRRTFRLVVGVDGLTITTAQEHQGQEIRPARIFMSYRRDDTDYPAAWLFAELVEHFDREQVFKDVDSIELGDDFAEVITSAVASCDVLLALIGRRWLTVTGRGGRRRLDNPDDFVRVEIEAALTRNVRVIPILVEAAQMPRADELPASLAKLPRRQALELSSCRFGLDAQRLLRTLDRILTESQRQSWQQAGRANRSPQPPGPNGATDSASLSAPGAVPGQVTSGAVCANFGDVLVTADEINQAIAWLMDTLGGHESFTYAMESRRNPLADWARNGYRGLKTWSSTRVPHKPQIASYLREELAHIQDVSSRGITS